MPLPSLRLILVRHAQADAGFRGPIAGPTGCRGLTPLGRRQAEALHDHFSSTARVRPDTLLASVLPRSVETAGIIAPGLGVELAEQDCDLCEFHTGVADGIDWTRLQRPLRLIRHGAEPDRPSLPAATASWNSFHGRVARTLERLAREHEGQTVVVVSHAGFIMASMRLLLGIADPSTSAHLQPANTGLTEWEWHEPSGRWILRYFNETVHLLGLAPPEEFSTESARVAAAAAPRRARGVGHPVPREPGQRQPGVGKAAVRIRRAAGWARSSFRSMNSTAWPVRRVARIGGRRRRRVATGRQRAAGQDRRGRRAAARYRHLRRRPTEAGGRQP